MGVSCEMAIVPDRDLAVVVLCNTSSRQPETLLVQIVTSLLSISPDLFTQHQDWSGSGDTEDCMNLPESGTWEGEVHLPDANVPLSLRLDGSGSVLVQLDGQPQAVLNDVSYQREGVQFLNRSICPYLRGWFEAEIDDEDVKRGAPYRTWLELTRSRSGDLTGVLVCFSRRDLPVGPLSHWVHLRPVHSTVPTCGDRGADSDGEE